MKSLIAALRLAAREAVLAADTAPAAMERLRLRRLAEVLHAEANALASTAPAAPVRTPLLKVI